MRTIMDDDDSHMLGEAVGRRHTLPLSKKRKTIGYFRRPLSQEPNGDSNQSLHLHNSSNSNISSSSIIGIGRRRSNPAPLAGVCHASSSYCNKNARTTANFPLSRFDSSSSSLFSNGSLGPSRVPGGLPDYIVDIPPIPNLQEDVRGSTTTTTSAPAIRSFLAFRSCNSPSGD